MNELWRVLQGETLVGLKMENATPWSVIDTLRLACVDYVATVEPFGLRSTLFFGKDWWPYHYEYNKRFLEQTKEEQESQLRGLADSITDPNAESFFRRRSFLQVHYCHSEMNLIASEIEASAEGWATAVQAIGSFAGSTTPGFLNATTQETSSVQFIDTDIFPEQQRMKLVKSGLYSSNAARIQAEAASITAQTIAGAAEGGLPGAILQGAAGTVGAALLSTNVLNNYAVGVLHDEVREMYRGSVFQQGNAWIRPRHLIHFVDSFREIAGPVEVKEVVHSFSVGGGFVTRWSPDCVAYAQDTQKLSGTLLYLNGVRKPVRQMDRLWCGKAENG